MRLVVAGLGYVGSQVLRIAAAMPEVDDLLLVTHEPAEWMVDCRDTARELGVAWTTESINTAELYSPDVISSAWYRTIVKPHVIESVGGRIFNLHPALLPRHRGCSSVPWAIIEGDQETGVTAHYIDAGVDTGRVLFQESIPILPTDTQWDLYDHCQRIAVTMWSEAFRRVCEGDPGTPQESGGCHHPRGAPHGGEIDPAWDEATVERFVRAMTFPPLPYATLAGREVASIEEWLALQHQ